MNGWDKKQKSLLKLGVKNSNKLIHGKNQIKKDRNWRWKEFNSQIKSLIVVKLG